MIKVMDLKKKFSLYPVLEGINLDIALGEFVVIMGDSGSGKTTFLNCLSGIESPSSGKVFINSREINALTNQQKQELRLLEIGFIFQDHSLINNLTLLENVALSRLQYDKDAMPKAIDFLTKIGIDHIKDHYPTQVSGGEKQRAAIARALINEPDFIFADEPTASINKKMATEIMEILKSLNKDGQTILLATHSHSIAAYGNRLLLLDDGKFREDVLLGDDISENLRTIARLGGM